MRLKAKEKIYIFNSYVKFLITLLLFLPRWTTQTLQTWTKCFIYDYILLTLKYRYWFYPMQRPSTLLFSMYTYYFLYRNILNDYLILVFFFLFLTHPLVQNIFFFSKISSILIFSPYILLKLHPMYLILIKICNVTVFTFIILLFVFIYWWLTYNLHILMVYVDVNPFSLITSRFLCIDSFSLHYPVFFTLSRFLCIVPFSLHCPFSLPLSGFHFLEIFIVCFTSFLSFFG